MYDYTRYDHATYTLPLWEGDTVYNETVMFMGKREAPLLYRADKILSVRAYDLKTEYVEGEDYLLKDGKLVITENSRIPFLSEEEYYPAEPEKGKYLGSSIEGKPYIYFSEGAAIFMRQVHVTYTHSDKWDGFVPAYSAKLERFRRKVASGERVNVLFYGDSITTGLNSSGKVGCEPFAESWCDMFVKSLRKTYRNENIVTYNTAVSGKTLVWGYENLYSRAIRHKPDLMVLAFGMNDGHMNPEDFCQKLGELLDKFRVNCPDCDIAVVSTTVANSDASNVFCGNQPYFEKGMIELCKDMEHVDIVPMTSVHKALLQKKRFYDMTGNNVNHPNDFLARAYAQTMIKTVIGEQKQRTLKDYRINGREIKDYAITYEQGSVWARRIAYKLRGHILDEYGVRLDVSVAERETLRVGSVADYKQGMDITEVSALHNKCEISVGFTDAMDVAVYDHEYVIYVSGNRMFIVARGAFAYEEAEKYLYNEIFADGKRELVDQDMICCDIRDTVTDARRFAYQKQGEYRIMSANICGSFGRKEPNPIAQVAYRDERLQYFKETVLEYLPDFIGVQEHGSEWRNMPTFINRFLPSIGYREARSGADDNLDNTPVYYRADRFSLIDCGWHVYSGANNGNSKSFAWGVFKNKKTGELVGAFSTHYYYTGDEIGKETRKQNSRELSAGVREMSEKYGCAFVGCGDFNSTFLEPPHEILRQNGMVNAYDMAKIRTEIGSCKEGPVFDAEIGLLTTEYDCETSDNFRRSVIDHFFVMGKGVKVGLVDTLVSETALLTTDHTLLISDFSIE